MLKNETLSVSASDDPVDQSIVGLVLMGGNINHINPKDGTTPLCVAVSSGCDKAVMLLIERGVNVNQPCANGQTALLIATSNGNEKAVELLLNARIDMGGVVGGRYIAPLSIAVERGYEGVVDILKGAAVNRKFDTQTWTPLCLAIYNKNNKTVGNLISKGANVNLICEEGGTPAILAVQRKDYKSLVQLVKAGANVNAGLRHGASPLYTAEMKGYVEFVKYLIEVADAEVNKEGYKGSNAIFVASHQGHLEVVDALIKAGADVNKPAIYKGEMGFSSVPLLAACISRHVEVAKLLVQNNAIIFPEVRDCLHNNMPQVEIMGNECEYNGEI